MKWRAAVQLISPATSSTTRIMSPRFLCNLAAYDVVRCVCQAPEAGGPSGAGGTCGGGAGGTGSTSGAGGGRGGSEAREARGGRGGCQRRGARRPHGPTRRHLGRRPQGRRRRRRGWGCRGHRTGVMTATAITKSAHSPPSELVCAMLRHMLTCLLHSIHLDTPDSLNMKRLDTRAPISLPTPPLSATDDMWIA